MELAALQAMSEQGRPGPQSCWPSLECVSGGAGQGQASDDPNLYSGGNVTMAGGYAATARGGSALARTGYGEETSSGIIDISTANGGGRGVSGQIDFSTGTASAGNTGYMNIETGDATATQSGKAGFVHVLVGRGNSNRGGDIVMVSGHTTSTGSSATGGLIKVVTGYSSPTTSGSFTLDTANAGKVGVSGAIHFATGTTNYGNSGIVTATTGLSKDGSAGNVEIFVGTGDSGDGGDILMTAGKATASKSTGGMVVVSAGHGSSDDKGDGGDGGTIYVFAGEAAGEETVLDLGGNIELFGGVAVCLSAVGGAAVRRVGRKRVQWALLWRGRE